MATAIAITTGIFLVIGAFVVLLEAAEWAYGLYPPVSQWAVMFVVVAVVLWAVIALDRP